MENPVTERFWELISRKLTNEATSEELVELEGLLHQKYEEAYSLEIMNDFWNIPPREDNQYAERQFKELTQKMEKMGINTVGFHLEEDKLVVAQSVNSYKYKPWYVSKKMLLSSLAIILVFFFSLSLFFSLNKKPTTLLLARASEITTKDGSKTNIVLPDGTKVWVNAGSKLTYDINYGNKLREVSLLGEAFFDVVKNGEKPFIIHTSKMDIKVLGTAFNVRCYPNEKKTETSLIRGRIEVTLKDRSSEKIYLSPNEKLTLINNKTTTSEIIKSKGIKQNIQTNEPIISIGHITLKPIDSSVIETSWIENKLEFRGETFEEVAFKMERWYGVKIFIEGEKLKQEHLTGSFETETVEQALNALQYTTRFKFVINKKNITITK